MSHGDMSSPLPPGFNVSSRLHRSRAGRGDGRRGARWYGVQFHPEVTHTMQGARMLRRFVRGHLRLRRAVDGGQHHRRPDRRVRAQVGNDEVLLGLSGGVDSSVVAALLHRAIGEQLTCVFVDTGLLRWHEGDQVMAMFAKNMGVKVIRVNAADRYFARLKGVDDPEAKRKIIGNLFVEIFDEGRRSSPT
jgi:GMP synthase (glutamine-hydrolysing)